VSKKWQWLRANYTKITDEAKHRVFLVAQTRSLIAQPSKCRGILGICAEQKKEAATAGAGTIGYEK
jgi:hypothetical protein